MFPDRLKGLLRSPGSPLHSSTAEDREAAPLEFVPRNSSGLDQFFAYIKGESGLTILDLGGANQDNITFITTLGHKLYTEDLLRSLRLLTLPNGDGDSAHPDRIASFLSQNLDYPEEHFDGVLIWDVLEHLEPALLAATVERLLQIVKPGSYLLSIFHAQDKLETVPVDSFRIRDARTLLVAGRGRRKPAQIFNNRSLEKLFHNFNSLKFFLTKDNLREVIVKR